MVISFIRLLVRTFYRCLFFVRVEGAENVPREGAVMITPNHISYWDPALIGAFCPRCVRFMAKAELFNNKPFGLLIKALGAFPVARGGGDVEAIKNSIRILKDGGALVMFPHGRRIRPGEDVMIKEGAVVIAMRAKALIVPAYIEGSYKPFRPMTLKLGKPVDFSCKVNGRITAEIQKEAAEELWGKMKELHQGL